MWNEGGKLNSCILRRKTIKANLSRTLEHISLITMDRKKAEEELSGKIWNEGGIKKELTNNINSDTFLNHKTSVAVVYMYVNHREAHETTRCI